MAKRAYRWKWTAAIEPDTLTVLQELSTSLGFFVERPGGKMGLPSPADMLDAIAAAYRENPDAVAEAMRSLGVVGSQSQ